MALPVEIARGKEIPNLFCVLVIEYWNLRFVCNLVLEIWDFISRQEIILLPDHL